MAEETEVNAVVGRDVARIELTVGVATVGNEEAEVVRASTVPSFGVETRGELVAMGEAQSVHEIPAAFPSLARRGRGVEVTRAGGDDKTGVATV